MLPNVHLDSTIDRYIELLGKAGLAEWQKGSGRSYIEWVNRKESVFHLAFTFSARPLMSNLVSGLGRTRSRNVQSRIALVQRKERR